MDSTVINWTLAILGGLATLAVVAVWHSDVSCDNFGEMLLRRGRYLRHMAEARKKFEAEEKRTEVTA